MIFLKIFFLSLILSVFNANADSGLNRNKLALTPPMGWNSFDSYGVFLHEDAAISNLGAMAE